MEYVIVLDGGNMRNILYVYIYIYRHADTTSVQSGITKLKLLYSC